MRCVPARAESTGHLLARFAPTALAAAWLWTVGTSHVAQAQPADDPPVAQAAGSGPLETTIVVEMLSIETGPDDHEVRRWVPPQRLAAGDQLHYTVRVRNPGKAPVTDVVVTKRLPFGMRYDPGSASCPDCEVQLSLDGGRTFVSRDSVLGKEGRGQKRSRRAVDPASFTHVRWVLARPLAPGAVALLRFRATFA